MRQRSEKIFEKNLLRGHGALRMVCRVLCEDAPEPGVKVRQDLAKAGSKKAKKPVDTCRAGKYILRRNSTAAQSRFEKANTARGIVVCGRQPGCRTGF